MNKIILIGRLTRDPEMKTLESGTELCKFSLAVNKRFRSDEADFFDCTAFGKCAEFCSKWFSKGQQVAVDGRIESREYKGRDGNMRKVWDVTVDIAFFADTKKSRQKDEYEDPEDDEIDETDDDLDLDLDDDDDLPF